MQLINKEVVVGTLKYLDFKVTGDHSNRKLVFLMKESPSSSIKIVEKKNLLAGGSNTQISCSYGGVYSTINVKLDPLDTQGKTLGYYSFTLISTSGTDSTDIVSLVSGYVNLVPNVQLPGDLTWVDDTTLNDQIYDKVLIAQVGSGGVVTKLKDVGFSATLVGAKLATGVYAITSDLPIFSTQLEVDCKTLNTSNLNSLMTFNNNLGNSLTVLQIGCYDINSSMVMDVDFLLTIKRIRT